MGGATLTVAVLVLSALKLYCTGVLPSPLAIFLRDGANLGEDYKVGTGVFYLTYRLVQ